MAANMKGMVGRLMLTGRLVQHFSSGRALGFDQCRRGKKEECLSGWMDGCWAEGAGKSGWNEKRARIENKEKNGDGLKEGDRLKKGDRQRGNRLKGDR